MNDTQDEEVLQQVEREVRIREGASRLLAACTQRDQALEVSKTLLTCNTRILALLSQLQRMRKEQVLQRAGRRSSEETRACVGTVALSGLRIPLMWKDSEYFKNKGELHRCAVFCLLQCGTEIQDTELVLVDRTLTDVCFEDPVVFENVSPDFVLRVEVYSSFVVDDFSPAPISPKRVGRLGGSLGCSSGKKIRAAFESAAVCGSVSGGRSASVSPPLLPDLFALGPKYNLLAHTTLRLHHVHNGFKTHDFSLTASEESPFWLPLYGNMCCRLVAQPLCLTQTPISGPLQVQVSLRSFPRLNKTHTLVQLDGEDGWRSVIGVLRGRSLDCYQGPEDLQEERSPVIEISISKSDGCQLLHINKSDVTHMLTAEDTHRWFLALKHHVFSLDESLHQAKELSSVLTNTYELEARSSRRGNCFVRMSPGFLFNRKSPGEDLGVGAEWKKCAEDLMMIEPAKNCSGRKSLTVKPRSLFHEIVSPCCPTEGAAVPDLSLEIRARLWHYYKESY